MPYFSIVGRLHTRRASGWMKDYRRSRPVAIKSPLCFTSYIVGYQAPVNAAVRVRRLAFRLFVSARFIHMGMPLSNCWMSDPH